MSTLPTSPSGDTELNTQCTTVSGGFVYLDPTPDLVLLSRSGRVLSSAEVFGAPSFEDAVGSEEGGCR